VFLHDTKSFPGQTKTGERVTLAPTLLGLTVGVSLPRAVLVKHPGGVFNLHHPSAFGQSTYPTGGGSRDYRGLSLCGDGLRKCFRIWPKVNGSALWTPQCRELLPRRAESTFQSPDQLNTRRRSPRSPCRHKVQKDQ
jgi:hypothetical protein